MQGRATLRYTSWITRDKEIAKQLSLRRSEKRVLDGSGEFDRTAPHWCQLPSASANRPAGKIAPVTDSGHILRVYGSADRQQRHNDRAVPSRRATAAFWEVFITMIIACTSRSRH